MERLILAEPGLKGSTGHEHAHARVLATECARRELPFHVLAYGQASDAAIQGLPAQRTFRVSVYQRPSSRGRMAALADMRRWSRKFRRDFGAALDRLHVGCGDLLLLNTVKIPVLAGIDGWLSARHESLLPAVAVVLRLGAEEGLPGGLMPDVSRWLYRRVLNKLHNHLGPRLLLAADTRLIGDEFERLVGRPVVPIPLPIDVPQPPPPPASPVSTHLVFPSSGVDRGFHLLPDALAKALPGNPGLVVTVRAPLHRRDGDDAAIERLTRMAPRVRLIDGALDEPDFYSLLAEADAALLTYNPMVFAKRSSQILAQTAALGRPVIVMAGSFLDYERQSNGIVGVAARAFTAEALADAIQRFVNHREELVAAAWKACPAQRRRHSTAAFMDRLVAFTEAASGRALEPWLSKSFTPEVRT